MGMGHDAMEVTRDKAYQAEDAASDTAGDRARDGAQQTGSYLSQTAEVAGDLWTCEAYSAMQAGETVMNTAVGIKDKVVVQK
ncbi:hypothetical protein HU200_026262 [Digitaria exilis]|uniref:Uncharacterized protein n=1 Tax=Digitaria exilis TaxID=1010633 RepID=A0A835C8A7_9POAL|nr:hypothetical protein HU200_026262 [Digitaria exilis]